ncbi:MAG: LysM peptidoglycan-binding domain-containing protein, partial [Actinomycetota bacterium]
MRDDYDDDETVETYVSRKREPGDRPPVRKPGGAGGFDQMPNVLWGRVVALFAILLFTFLLGRACAPEGVPQSRLEETEQELAEAKADLEQARKATPTPAATFPTTVQTTAPAVTATPSPTATAAAATRTQTYTVKSGDTLLGISKTFYGTTRYADLIKEANQIPDTTALTVGKK